MIFLPMPGYMFCDEKDCQAKQQAQLYLTVTGGMCFKPTSDAVWQVHYKAGGDGPVMCRCPLHAIPEQKVQPISIMPSIGRQREH